MSNTMLLATFFETYGIWIILIVLFLALWLFNLYRQKKFASMEVSLLERLVPGTKVKTYSGFYGEVVKITDTTDGKVVTLKLSENSFIDIDFHAIMAIDEKKTMEEVEMLEKLNNVSNVETAEIKEPVVKEPNLEEVKTEENKEEHITEKEVEEEKKDDDTKNSTKKTSNKKK